jgi:hypothetical protein
MVGHSQVKSRRKRNSADKKQEQDKSRALGEHEGLSSSTCMIAQIYVDFGLLALKGSEALLRTCVCEAIMHRLPNTPP